MNDPSGSYATPVASTCQLATGIGIGTVHTADVALSTVRTSHPPDTR
jgi:hypothetical protein